MRKTIGTLSLAALGISGIALAVSRSPAAQAPPATRAPAPAAQRGGPGTMPPVYKLEDAFLRWALPPGEQAYAGIEGRHMYQYVVEQAAIARRYRDQGHPQFWGRIIGTSSDTD